MKKQKWFTKYGTVRPEHAAEFALISRQVKNVLARLEGHVSYRDLYEIASQAGATAVGEMVSTRVNKKR